MEHQGAILEKAIRNSDISIKRLAELLNVNRTTIYYWFENPRLSPEVLVRINHIIQSDYLNFSSVNADKTLQKNRQEADFWKTKYLHLLDQYQCFLQKRI